MKSMLGKIYLYVCRYKHFISPSVTQRENNNVFVYVYLHRKIISTKTPYICSHSSCYISRKEVNPYSRDNNKQQQH
jgi:hypothetical protein